MIRTYGLKKYSDRLIDAAVLSITEVKLDRSSMFCVCDRDKIFSCSHGNHENVHLCCSSSKMSSKIFIRLILYFLNGMIIRQSHVLLLQTCIILFAVFFFLAQVYIKYYFMSVCIDNLPTTGDSPGCSDCKKRKKQNKFRVFPGLPCAFYFSIMSFIV